MKGQKTGGRAKGVPNRTTTELRDLIKSIVDKELSNLESTLNELEPMQKVDALLKLLPYVVTKQTEQATDGNHQLIVKVETQEAANLIYRLQKGTHYENNKGSF